MILQNPNKYTCAIYDIGKLLLEQGIATKGTYPDSIEEQEKIHLVIPDKIISDIYYIFNKANTTEIRKMKSIRIKIENVLAKRLPKKHKFGSVKVGLRKDITKLIRDVLTQ